MLAAMLFKIEVMGGMSLLNRETIGTFRTCSGMRERLHTCDTLTLFGPCNLSELCSLHNTIRRKNL